jgi:hypothetical protein
LCPGCGTPHRSCRTALRTEACILGDVIVLRCMGRLVIGEDTTAFREEVKKLLSEKAQGCSRLNEIEHAEAYNTAGNPEVLKILDKD